jgi:monoamine oxidase
MPPSNVSRINFQPTLSPERRFITEKTFMGSIGKILVRYKECYWKQKLYSGEVLSDGSDCPITLVYDDTKAK